MNYELAAPQHLISLASSSLIVSVEVNVWTATKRDKTISNEVTTAKGAVADAGDFTKRLLANCPAHKALLNYRQTVYNWLQRCSFDWAGSHRLIPTFQLEKFNKEFAQHEAEFNRLKQDFTAAYPSLVSDAAFKQGSMFDRSEYPEVEEIEGKFRIKKFITQVPTNDFRSGGIAEAMAEDLKQHYEQQTKDLINDVMADATERLLSMAERLRNACSEVEKDDGTVKRKRIYESTFDNVREMAQLLKHFNLTNNPQLEEARAKLEAALSTTTLDALRESAYARATVKNDLDDVLSKFRPLSV
jgi:hypothetical protein